jgi:hypothetical protein
LNEVRCPMASMDAVPAKFSASLRWQLKWNWNERDIFLKWFCKVPRWCICKKNNLLISALLSGAFHNRFRTVWFLFHFYLISISFQCNFNCECSSRFVAKQLWKPRTFSRPTRYHIGHIDDEILNKWTLITTSRAWTSTTSASSRPSRCDTYI